MHVKLMVWALAALFLAGCSATAANGHDPDTLIDLARADGATMNPWFATTVEDGAIYAALLYDSLVGTGADYLPRPELATSWTHSVDGKHWTVNLRHGVRWSDGAPFTSKDVVFSYNTMRDPRTVFVGYGDVQYITRVYADGPYRVRFDLAYPSAVFTSIALGENVLPEHILGKVPAGQLRFADFGEHPVGTGPYMLSRWQHDSEALFVANPYAWRKPKIKRIDIRIIFDDQAEVDALANGSADIIDDMSYTQSRRLAKLNPNIIIQTFASLYLDTIECNTRRPGLNDVVVRQAMMYGYDRMAIIKGLFAGQVEYPDSFIVKALTYWHTNDVPKYPYDPAKARAMLDADGWRVGADGIRRKGNVRLSFELMLNQGSALITDEMLTYVADMRAIGINVNLRLMDFATMSSRTFTGKYDLFADGRGGWTDPDLTSILASTQTPPNGFNTTFYHNPRVDRDLKLGLQTIDPAKRKVYYDDMQRELARTLPILYQYGRFASLGRDSRLHLPPRATLQSPLLFFNVEDWTLSS